eukprot:7855749-Lingulodinium_polyedra.AAC.1
MRRLLPMEDQQAKLVRKLSEQIEKGSRNNPHKVIGRMIFYSELCGMIKERTARGHYAASASVYRQ